MGSEESLASAFLAWCGAAVAGLDHEALMVGMFLGGLLMAMVPISLSIGIGIWAFKQRRAAGDRAAQPPEAPPTEVVPGAGSPRSARS